MGKITLGTRYAITAFAIIGLTVAYLSIIAINNMMYENRISLHFMLYCTIYGLPFLVIAGLISNFIVHWSNKNQWAKRNEFSSTILQYAVSIVVAVLFTLIGFVLFDPYQHETLGELFGMQYFQVSIITTPILNIFILFVTKYTEQIATLRNQEERILQAENEIMKVRYQQLKAQVNPHFLFNTLTVLSSLIKTDQNKATIFTNQLASIYRYLLSTDDNDLVPLTDELQFCAKYADILSMRYGDGLNINMPSTDDAVYARFLIIPTALQILIENACKHNLISTKRPLGIDIHVNCYISPADSTDLCFISVTNNIQTRKAPADSTGLGLKGLKQKYQLLTQKEITIDHTTDTFRVRIPLIINQ